MKHGLTDVPGIRVGHAQDSEALTGCTAILCEAGAVAGLSVGGSATGTEELDLLNPLHLTPAIHGICLSGGSAFGLEAASGVRRWLEEKGVGFPTAHAKVPLVVGAILYDLGIGKSDVRPGREMGYAAAQASTTGPVAEGCVGAGTGATVGKLRGMTHSMKGGIGAWSARFGDVTVAALAAVNAWGDVVHPRTRTIIAGTRTTPDSREFANSVERLKAGRPVAPVGGNTTLTVVATDARLTKVQATKLAQLAQHGVIASIAPVHTIYDGDLMFALSVGPQSADFSGLGVVAAEVVAEAIVRAVRMSWTQGGVPGLAPAP
ncbi:MAG TPA: P1 family peptidase [Bryobacteraceae bacterium]|nr:P1 family peptidase [Bryobacteraceae bacterium]